MIASLGIGLLQTFAVSLDTSVASVVTALGLQGWMGTWPASGPLGWTRIGTAQVAPLLPFLLLVAMLVLRPKGILGSRET